MTEFPRVKYTRDVIIGEFTLPKGNLKAKKLMKELYDEGLKTYHEVSSTYIMLSNTTIFIHFYLKNNTGKTTSVLNLYKDGLEMYSLKELREIIYNLSRASLKTQIKNFLTEEEFERHIIEKYDMNLIQLGLCFKQKEF
nr:MAG TPA: hypothetical protein [Bacteriophage sp.]